MDEFMMEKRLEKEGEVVCVEHGILA